MYRPRKMRNSVALDQKWLNTANHQSLKLPKIFLALFFIHGFVNNSTGSLLAKTKGYIMHSFCTDHKW